MVVNFSVYTRYFQCYAQHRFLFYRIFFSICVGRMQLTFTGQREATFSHEVHLLKSNHYCGRWQPRPQGLLLVQNGGRRNPWPRLLKYSKNRGVFCHVTHEEMAFLEVVSSVWRPCLFSAIGNRCPNETKTFHRVYLTTF